MLPFITVAGIRISTYLLMFYIVGGTSVFVATVIRAKIYHIPRWKACMLTAVFLLFGIVGAKIAFLLESPVDHYDSFWTLKTGYNFCGSVLLVALSAWCFGPLFGLNRKTSLDFCSILLAVMISSVRIGCYLGGCCYGMIGGEKIPVQLFEACGDFYLLIFLTYKESVGKLKDRSWQCFATCYGFWRFFWELFMPLPNAFLGMSTREWMSLLVGLFGFAALAYDEFRRKDRKGGC